MKLNLKKWVSEHAGWTYFLGVVVFALLMFRVLLHPGSILFTTDDNVGALALRKSVLPYVFWGGWYDAVLVGMSWFESLNWTNLMLWIFPAGFFTNWIHAADCILMSFFLALFLRERGQSWCACALGALTAFWLGSNFTLTYAGHIGKFGVMMFASLALWLVEKSVKTRRLSWSMLAGGALGGMFLEQADVALFVAMFLVPYAIFALVRDTGWKIGPLLKVLIPMGALTFIIAFNPLWSGYRTSVKGMASNATQEDPKGNWDFATQWSWPPEESIDFIAPGFMGWRSGEPEGPYYGRMGRSAEWEKTGQGFQNFKLENHYLGAIPVVMAIWALFAAWISRRQKSAWQAEVWFWGIAMLVALVLSFGRYFPLYRLFFMLPMVSSIRNPNKFLHVFQLAVGVLSAYGLDLLWQRAGSNDWLKGASTTAIKRFAMAIGGVAVIFFLWGMVTVSSETELLARFAGWGEYASSIIKNRGWALTHAAVMTAIAAGILFWFMRPSLNARRGLWVLMVIVAFDALILGRHYVSAMPPNLIQENDVVKFLKTRQQFQRTALVSQQGFYNAWLTYVFPYYGIRSLNFTQMPRMPEDYKQFLGQVGPNVVQLWKLTSCEWIAGPAQFWSQIQADPKMRDMFELAYAFNAFPDPAGGMHITTATATSPGQHVIAHLKDPVPRYGLLDQWISQTSDEETLKMLASPSFVPYSKALLSPDVKEAPASAAEGKGLTGSVNVRDYRSGRVRLQVSSEKPALLRSSDKYDSDWKAWVDGRPTPVHRVDYLFQGVFVEPGIHEVILSFAPARWPFMVQLAGILICVLAVTWVIRLRRKEQAA
jgi:hypothetical protein